MNESTDTKREELKAQLAAIANGNRMTPEPLAKQPVFQGRQVETLAIAQDNAVLAKHPEMTQFLGAEEMQSLEALGQALPGIEQQKSPALSAPVVVSPIPAEATTVRTAKPAPSRIVLTGKSGAGKTWLAMQIGGAVTLELTDPIDRWLSEQYPEAPAGSLDNFRATIKAWGNGAISEKYPLSPARFLFSVLMREKWPAFGTPNFWVNQLIAAAGDSVQQVVVTRIESSAEYKALTDAGFRHYHITCSVQTAAVRPQRKNADNRLAIAMDQDVISKLSRQRTGEMLRCVWNDPGISPPSPRLFTVAQWLQEMQIAALPETGE